MRIGIRDIPIPIQPRNPRQRSVERERNNLTQTQLFVSHRLSLSRRRPSIAAFLAHSPRQPAPYSRVLKRATGTACSAQPARTAERRRRRRARGQPTRSARKDLAQSRGEPAPPPAPPPPPEPEPEAAPEPEPEPEAAPEAEAEGDPAEEEKPPEA